MAVFHNSVGSPQGAIELLKEALVFYGDPYCQRWLRLPWQGEEPPGEWRWLDGGEDSGPAMARVALQAVSGLGVRGNPRQWQLISALVLPARLYASSKSWCRIKHPTDDGISWQVNHAAPGRGPLLARRVLLHHFPDEYEDVPSGVQ